MQPERHHPSPIANDLATPTNRLSRPRRVSVRYDWDSQSRERCFQVIDGELSPCECLASPTAPGLGDAVAAATKSVGVKPCGGCAKRQAALNRATPAWARRALGWWSRHFGVP